VSKRNIEENQKRDYTIKKVTEWDGKHIERYKGVRGGRKKGHLHFKPGRSPERNNRNALRDRLKKESLEHWKRER